MSTKCKEIPSAEQTKKLVGLMDGYFGRGAQHLNVNVFNRETLIDAQKHPENYPDLIVRVAGYSAIFVNLTPDIQEELLSRVLYD